MPFEQENPQGQPSPEMPPDMAAPHPPAQESAENYREKFSKASFFEELYPVLREKGKIKGEDAEVTINKIKSIEEDQLSVLIGDITREDGLRDAVKRLYRAKYPDATNI